MTNPTTGFPETYFKDMANQYSNQNSFKTLIDFAAAITLIVVNILALTGGISPTALGVVNISITGYSFAGSLLGDSKFKTLNIILTALAAAALITCNILMLQGNLSMATVGWVHLIPQMVAVGCGSLASSCLCVALATGDRIIAP